MKKYLFAVGLLGTFTAVIAFQPLCWLSFACAYLFWGCMLMPMLGSE